MNARAQTQTHLALLMALAALAGCGGGGDSTPAASPPASPAPAPPAASPPPASPAPGPSAPPPTVAGTRATCNLANMASDLLTIVNQHRAAGASCGARGSFPAVPALAWNDALTQASLVHSDDMVARNFFSHTGSSGSSAGDRATAAGYSWRTWGENIAAGQATVAVVMAGWMASDGHCANIMNANMRDIGVACVAGGAGNTYRTYWTMTLGATR
jgi:uncharacterized protein YkwD